MKLHEYFDAEIKSTLAHILLGIAAGYASFLVNSTSMGFLFALAGLGLGYAFSTQYLKQETKKWYGYSFVLLLTWLIVWTLFYNAAIR
jgi:hypothetical protein